MKSAGWWMISYGCESGNNKVLEMNKKEATVEQAEKAIKWAKDAGLRVWGYFMLGMYGETYESMDQTIRFSRKMPLDIVNFAISAPYPGTEWGKIALENNWIRDRKWEAYDQNFSAQVEQPDCSTTLVKEMQKKAYLKWYLSLRGFKFFMNGFRPEYFSYFMSSIWNHLK